MTRTPYACSFPDSGEIAELSEPVLGDRRPIKDRGGLIVKRIRPTALVIACSDLNDLARDNLILLLQRDRGESF
jgi:hypothetical protein